MKCNALFFLKDCTDCKVVHYFLRDMPHLCVRVIYREPSISLNKKVLLEALEQYDLA